MNTQPTFLFVCIFDSINYGQKAVNQTTLNHTTPKNLALRILEAFVRVLLNVNLSLPESNSPNILALCETNLDDKLRLNKSN